MRLERLAPEWRRFRDLETGVEVRQWTGGPTMNHHLYFTNPSFSGDGRLGLFVSYRGGYPDLHAIDLESGEILRVTRRADLNPFSPAASPSEAVAFFSAGHRVLRVELSTGAEEVLACFPGARLGNCSLNREGTELALGVRYSRYCELVVVGTATGRAEAAVRADEVGHVQFCPLDRELLLFSGPIGRRLWCHDRRAGKTWQVLREDPGQWLVHESWLGFSRRIMYVLWPYALLAVDPDGSEPAELAGVNAWHPRSDPSGRRVVFDTAHPDRGLLVLELPGGQPRLLCRPGATCRGSQWRYDRPAESPGMDTSIIRSDRPEEDTPPSPDDPESLYGPQWSHPHPSFALDGRRIVYTSDRDRFSHVYSLLLPEPSALPG